MTPPRQASLTTRLDHPAWCRNRWVPSSSARVRAGGHFIGEGAGLSGSSSFWKGFVPGQNLLKTKPKTYPVPAPPLAAKDLWCTELPDNSSSLHSRPRLSQGKVSLAFYERSPHLAILSGKIHLWDLGFEWRHVQSLEDSSGQDAVPRGLARPSGFVPWPNNPGGRFGGGSFPLMEDSFVKPHPLSYIKQLSLGLGNPGEFCPSVDSDGQMGTRPCLLRCPEPAAEVTFLIFWNSGPKDSSHLLGQSS